MVTFHPDYRGCDWRKLRAAALQESRAHRAYARLGYPPPKTQPLIMWPDTRLNFDELLPGAGERNGKPVTTKLSWQPLAEFCGQELPPDAATTHITDIGIVANLTGINRRTLHNYRRNGLTIWQADDIACTLGVHPSAIWARWYELTETDDDPTNT